MNTIRKKILLYVLVFGISASFQSPNAQAMYSPLPVIGSALKFLTGDSNLDPNLEQKNKFRLPVRRSLILLSTVLACQPMLSCSVLDRRSELEKHSHQTHTIFEQNRLQAIALLDQIPEWVPEPYVDVVGTNLAQLALNLPPEEFPTDLEDVLVLPKQYKNLATKPGTRSRPFIWAIKEIDFNTLRKETSQPLPKTPEEAAEKLSEKHTALYKIGLYNLLKGKEYPFAEFEHFTKYITPQFDYTREKYNLSFLSLAELIATTNTLEGDNLLKFLEGENPEFNFESFLRESNNPYLDFGLFSDPEYLEAVKNHLAREQYYYSGLCNYIANVEASYIIEKGSVTLKVEDPRNPNNELEIIVSDQERVLYNAMAYAKADYKKTFGNSTLITLNLGERQTKETKAKSPSEVYDVSVTKAIFASLVKPYNTIADFEDSYIVDNYPRASTTITSIEEVYLDDLELTPEQKSKFKNTEKIVLVEYKDGFTQLKHNGKNAPIEQFDGTHYKSAKTMIALNGFWPTMLESELAQLIDELPKDHKLALMKAETTLLPLDFYESFVTVSWEGIIPELAYQQNDENLIPVKVPREPVQ